MRISKYNVLFFILIFSIGNAKAQVYSLYNPNKILTTENGLVSNFVYGSVQDDDGFIWFYTDKGLSKFDGFRIKNFTTAEGLASANIWLVNRDVNNKLWLFTHDNILSYAKGDSIYKVDSFKNSSPLNITLRVSPDTLLVTTRFMNYNFYLVGKDKYNVIYYSDLTKTNQDYFNRIINKFDKVNYDSFARLLNFYPLRSNNFNSGYSIVFNNIVYSLSILSNLFYAYSLDSKKGILIKSENNNRFYWPIIKDDKMLLSGTDGLRVFRYDNLFKFYCIKEGANIFRSDLDNQENVWSGTQNEGAFFYNLNLSSNIISKNNFNTNLIYCSKVDNSVLIESSTKQLLILNNNMINILSNFSGIRESGKWFDNLIWFRGNNNHKLYDIQSNKLIDFLHYNKSLGFLDSSYTWKPYFSHSINSDSIITINSHQAQLITRKNNKFELSTFFNGLTRIFSTFLDSNNIFHINTLNNVYIFDRKLNLKDSISYSYNSNKLSVSALYNYPSNNTLVAGTNGQGLFYFTKMKNWKQIDNSSDLECKNIFALNNYLIAHTNKGIFTYIYKDGEFKFNTVYANSYGLNPDDIKLVYPYNDSIHVVTKNSILAFSPTLIDTTRDTLKVYECFVDNQKVSMEKTVLIPHDFKQLSFRFSTFNYTRMDDTKFRYRFNSSDPWIVLSSNHIELSQLASGDYKLEIEAFNKYSNEILANAIVPMRVLTPWYKSIWFILFANALTIGLIFYFYRRRLEQKKIVEDNIKALEYSLRESKIKLLENQMNPHFLFNSLTSIKSFIKDNDIKNADYYLGYFSKLMRLYLDSSRSSRISIHDEVELVRHYLILERMRFEDRFDFSIQVDSGLDTEGLRIPTMMIQPIVENSVRHGLFNRKSDGQLNVIIKAEEQDVLIEINDNGVGVAKSLELKSEADRSHQSHATRIIKEKIELLNNTLDYQIVVSTSELNPNDKENKGTRTIIRLKNLIE